jgi:hypothetical protein
MSSARRRSSSQRACAPRPPAPGRWRASAQCPLPPTSVATPAAPPSSMMWRATFSTPSARSGARPSPPSPSSRRSVSASGSLAWCSRSTTPSFFVPMRCGAPVSCLPWSGGQAPARMRRCPSRGLNTTRSAARPEPSLMPSPCCALSGHASRAVSRIPPSSPGTSFKCWGSRQRSGGR